MIPDAAVEAARRELAKGAYQMAPEELPYANAAHRALEAAAPHMEPTIKPKDFYRIQAMALREAFHEFPLETITAPDNAAVWMKNRADELDHKAERA